MEKAFYTTVDPNVKKDLEELLKLENEYHSKENMTNEQLQLKKKLIRKTNDLQFLVDEEEQSSNSEYGEEVY